ncbi:MAG: hypothetical protein JSU66_04305 [Deltaproteobacteria bacterium]|nr:MAG: hypothetical protein JSU66_04305 [Deltaproteobacteria bacterium]
MKRPLALALVSVALLCASCISLRVRDLRDLRFKEVECASLDERMRCSCYERCVVEETSCRCSD